MMKDIENIELQFLTVDDYHELKTAMIAAYTNMPGSFWSEKHIQALIEKFK